MPKVSNQLKDFLFRLSCFHISFCKSEWGRGQVSERREEKANTVCYNMCQQWSGWKKKVVGWEANEWERTTILNWKRGKLSLYIFLIFSDGLVCGEERENRLYIWSFVCRRTSSFFRESRDFPIQMRLWVCVCVWVRKVYNIERRVGCQKYVYM